MNITPGYLQHSLLEAVMHSQRNIHNAILAQSARLAESWMLRNGQMLQHMRRIEAAQIPHIWRIVQRVEGRLRREPSEPETRWSTAMMQEYHERQRRLQEHDASVDRARIRLDHIRSLSATVSSDFMLGRNLRCDDLRHLAGVPETATSAWLESAYRESSRSLSMDAVKWARRDTAVDPWTSWKASWNKSKIRFAPLAESTKSSMRRHRRDRIFGRVNQNARFPTIVSAFRRSHPSMRARSPDMKKKPRPHQGGFIEHLDENRRYRDMLRNRRQGAMRRKKGNDTNAEAVTKREVIRTKDGTEICISEREDDKDAVVVKQRRKRDIASTVGKWVLCFPRQPSEPGHSSTTSAAAVNGRPTGGTLYGVGDV